MIMPLYLFSYLARLLFLIVYNKMRIDVETNIMYITKCAVVLCMVATRLGV
jgi:hypothetical protein